MELSWLEAEHRKHLLSLRRSKNTFAFYAQAARQLRVFFGEDKRVEDITKFDLINFQLWLRERGLSPGGEHAIFRGLRAMFRWAVEEELLPQDPMRKFKLPSLPQTVQSAVSPALAGEIIKKAKRMSEFPTRNATIAALLFDTGLRVSEVANLDVQDVNFETGTLLVRAGKREKDRQVPFGVRLTRLLLLYIRKERKPCNDSIKKLFIGRGGMPLGASGVGQLMEKLAEEVGVPRKETAPHAWRRGFAVQFLRNGGDLFALQQILGHTSLDMTRKYVRYLPEDLVKLHLRFSPMDRL